MSKDQSIDSEKILSDAKREAVEIENKANLNLEKAVNEILKIILNTGENE